MKVALIGVGHWGKVLGGELSNLAEIKYQCDSKADLEPVFADPEVEAVFIATPTETHLGIAMSALLAGKHVFVEKPGTTSSADLEKLVQKAEEKNLKLAVGYEFPHHPALAKLKDLLNGRKIKSIHFQWNKWGTFKDNAVKHLLCHDISILRYLGMEDLSFVQHHCEGAISPTDITWTQFASKQAAYIESNINRVSPFKQKTMTVILEDGGYIWSNNELFEINGEELKKIEFTDTTPVRAELKDFLFSDQPICDGRFALEVYKVIESVRA